MKTVNVLVLFILGILLALIAFPVAFFTSALLGYIICIIAIILGALLIAKRAGKNLALVLGIVLVVIGLGVFGGILTMHIAVTGVKEAVEEATKPKYLEATLGSPIAAGDWRITVTKVKEVSYVMKDDSYYSAKEGEKIVIVTLRVENAGKETKSSSEVWSFTLVTNANKSYDKVYIFNLKYISSFDKEYAAAQAQAVKVSELEFFQSLAPNTYSEGDMLFTIPLSEKPVTLYFKVGIIAPYEISVKL